MEMQSHPAISRSLKATKKTRGIDPFAVAALDALSANIAILDHEGFILHTNESWNAFAGANGLAESSFEGINYLKVCDCAEGHSVEGATVVAAGIREVIAGAGDAFELEYPCHSPDKNRWFRMRVTRLKDYEPARVMVIHENVTDRRRAKKVQGELRGREEESRELKEVEQLLRLERDLALALGSTASLPEALKLLLEACLTLDHLDCGGIYLVDHETETLRLICHQGLSAGFVQQVSLYALSSPPGSFVMEGKAGYWSKPVTILEMGSLFEMEGLMALAAIPVQSGGEVAALLNVSSHTRTEVPLSVRDALESIARHIGDIISRVRLGEIIEGQSMRLRESNAALRVLLKQREEDRVELEESFLSNVKHLVLPCVSRLKKSRLTDDQLQLAELLESHLREVTSPFVRTIAAPMLGLTSTEIRVAELIRRGMSSKEIADLLLISENAVIFHRQGLRRKLGLLGKKVNLQAYLTTLL